MLTFEKTECLVGKHVIYVIHNTVCHTESNFVIYVTRHTVGKRVMSIPRHTVEKHVISIQRPTVGKRAISMANV